LALAPLSAETGRTYVSKVRQFLAWLAGPDVEGDPLRQPAARDWAVRDYRTHLQAVSKRAPATVNNALAALDDFYTRRGLGPAAADRAELASLAPRALDKRAVLRWLRAVESQPSARDRALADVPFYAGARIAETVRLDVEDVRLSARRGSLRLYGKGEKVREVPIHPQLRIELGHWSRERADWPRADANPALFLNRRGGRLSVRGASDVIAAIAERAGLGEEATSDARTRTPPLVRL
jgi:integrase/recombinase XerC